MNFCSSPIAIKNIEKLYLADVRSQWNFTSTGYSEM